MVKERIQKIMAAAGVASRRACEQLIIQGRVVVNGAVATIGQSAEASKDDIRVDGDRIAVPEHKVYLMMNKPANFITTVDDMYERRKVVDLLPPQYHDDRIYPIGRLDRDAEGLLLLTNDGEFANKVMHPRYEVTKTYRAWLDAPFTPEHMVRISRGVQLDDGMVSDIHVAVVAKDMVDITLHVGKNKVVKRIFNELGFRVKRLIRTKIGSLALLHLKPGQVVPLSQTMLDRIFQRPSRAKKDPATFETYRQKTPKRKR